MIKAKDIIVGYGRAASRPPASIFPDRAQSAARRKSNLPLVDSATIIAGPLSFSFKDGDCVMLRGRNGSGKTTLMKTVAGLLKPLSGTIETGGEAILVPTRIPKVKGFTIKDFVRTGMLAESGAFKKLDSKAESLVDDAIRMMDLNQLADKDLSRISDGEFQKACVAAALTRNANVLMLDEPTAFLDVENRVMVLSTLQRLAHETGTTVIFSTHDIQDGALYSDSVLAL